MKSRQCSAMKPIKIVSYNTYLICNRFNNNRITYPERRAAKICGDFLSSSNDQDHLQKENKATKIKPDLCFFQEVWGSGIQELTQAHDYCSPPRRHSWFSTSYQHHGIIKQLGFESFFGTITELIDTLYFHVQKTGGLFDVSSRSLTCRYRSKHTFTVSRSRSNKGVEATLWDIPQWSSGDSSDCDGDREQNRRRLLVFNTHLDPWHVANRKAQICEILDFMENTLQSIERIDPSIEAESNLQSSSSSSSSSSSKRDERKSREYDWSQTGVLVVGDFNIKAGSKEYRETLDYLKLFSIENNCWKDTFFVPGETEDGDEDQHTYALQNSMAEYPDDCGRIDYIFGIQSFKIPLETVDQKSQHQSHCPRIFMPLNVVSRSIRQEPIGDESSDHYALILEVIPDV